MTPNEFVKYCRFLGQQDGPVDYKSIVHDIMEKANYLETHYMISAYIEKYQDDIKSLVAIQNEYGMGGLWEKAESLTNEFQSKYDGTSWGEELDWHDTLDQFLTEKLQ